MPSDEELAAAASANVATIADVIAAMQAIQAAVPDEDGLGWFNRLYLLTTQNIAAGLAGGRFADPAWTEKLDVVFARYYFRAISEYLAGSALTPRAWTPLLAGRALRSVAPIQFAVAGMNAHIDRDLSFALVDLANEDGAFPDRGTARHADYETVNAILAATERQAKEWFEGIFLRRAEFVAGRIEDVIALWSVDQAREAAWMRGETQWSVRHLPAVAAALDAAIDRAAWLATRALLLPTRTA